MCHQPTQMSASPKEEQDRDVERVPQHLNRMCMIAAASPSPRACHGQQQCLKPDTMSRYKEMHAKQSRA